MSTLLARAALVALVLLLAAVPAMPTVPAAGGSLQAYTITVEGQPARGILGVPATPTPTTLVVYAHGFGGRAEDFNGTALAYANLGVLAVAMDYRGARTAWKVEAGWEDTLAATLDLQARYPSVDRVVLWGISMGGEVSGLAIAHAPPGTYDYWIDDAGVQNLAEQWAEVAGFRAAIQAETGGTPAEVPQAYADRSPALMADRIAAHGLTRAFFFHFPNDAVVPYSHARETAAQLVALGVPVSFYTALTGVAAPPAPPVPPPVPPTAPGVPSCHCASGSQAVFDKVAGKPDWPASIEGVLAPAAGFVPAISAPALPL